MISLIKRISYDLLSENIMYIYEIHPSIFTTLIVLLHIYKESNDVRIWDFAYIHTKINNAFIKQIYYSKYSTTISYLQLNLQLGLFLILLNLKSV